MQRRRSRVVTILVSVLLFSLGVVGVSSSTVQAVNARLNWIALGDSYSAGVGVTGGDGNPCYRNTNVAWSVVARNAISSTWPSASFALWACNKAKLDDIYGGSDRANSGEPLQINRITSSTNVVTMTGGGNDIGFADTVERCAAWALTVGALPRTQLTCPFIGYDNIPDQPGRRQNWDGLYDEMVETYVAVQKRMAPTGQLFVLTYPLFFASSNDWGLGAKTLGCDGIWGSDSAKLVNKGIIRVGDTMYWAVQEANRQLAASGRPGRVVFVDQRYTNDVNNPWDPNGVCGSYPVAQHTVNAITPSAIWPHSYHPTAWSYQQAGFKVAAKMRLNLGVLNVDSDGDGVPNSDDACPNTAGPASNTGCPLASPPPDRDTDGVPDASDGCPDTPGPGSNGGCPVAQGAPTAHIYGATSNIRAAATTAAAVVGTIPAGTAIPLLCWVRGQGVAASTGTYSLWHQTNYNGITGFVSDVVLDTPAFPAADADQPRPGETACPGIAGPSAHIYWGPANLRSDASTSTTIVGTVPTGTQIPLNCWRRGTGVTGSTGTYTLWHQTTYGGLTAFIADYVLDTPAFPAADADQPRPGEPACAGALVQQVVNGGFESGGGGWGPINLAASVNFAAYSNASRAHSGNGFYESNTNTPGGSIGQDTTISPQAGKYYWLRAWVRDASGGATPFVLTPTLWALGGAQENATNDVLVGSQWTPVDVVLHPTSSNHSVLRVEFYLGTTGRNIDFDDVSVTISDTPPPAPSRNPIGSLDTAVSTSPGTVTVTGWSFDPSDPSSPDTVHVYVGGQAGAPGAIGTSLGPVSSTRTDVGAAYPYAGSNHGFSATLQTALSGQVTVCAYGINVGPGNNAMLSNSCKTVTVQPKVESFAPVAPARLLDTRPTGASVDGAGIGGGPRPAGSVARVQVVGRAGVASAKAVVLNLTAVNPSGSGFATVFTCGGAIPASSALNFTTGATIANGVVARPDSTGAICVLTSNVTDLLVDVTGYMPASAQVVPLGPLRIMETRAGKSTADGQMNGLGRLAAGSVTELAVGGRVGVPAGAAAAVVNITAVNPTANGFITVFPCGVTRPNASTLNYTAAKTIANGATVALGVSGRVCIYTSQSTDVLVDISAQYPAGAAFSSAGPSRLLDSRAAHITVDGLSAGGGAVPAGSTTVVIVGGRGGIAEGARGVLVNITAVQPGGTGFLTIWACGTTRPNASTLNFRAGITIANNATVQLAADGRMCIYTSAATDVLVDVVGYFPA